MTAPNQKLEIWRGDSKVVSVPVVNPDGTAYDLTGAEVLWWAAPSPSAANGEVFFKKAVGDGITVVPGGVQITLTEEDTDPLAAGIHYHEMKIVKANMIATAMTGPFIVHRSLIDRTPTTAITVDAVIINAPEIGAPALGE